MSERRGTSSSSGPAAASAAPSPSAARKWGADHRPGRRADRLAELEALGCAAVVTDVTDSRRSAA